SHKDDLAVAIVDDTYEVGIDLERIEPRTESFCAIAFTEAEIALGAGRDRDEWHARVWAAKEAVAKALGTGMTDPKKFAVRASDGDKLCIASPGFAGARSDAQRRAEEIDFVVDTRRDGGYIVAWTRKS